MEKTNFMWKWWSRYSARGEYWGREVLPGAKTVPGKVLSREREWGIFAPKGLSWQAAWARPTLANTRKGMQCLPCERESEGEEHVQGHDRGSSLLQGARESILEEQDTSGLHTDGKTEVFTSEATMWQNLWQLETSLEIYLISNSCEIHIAWIGRNQELRASRNFYFSFAKTFQFYFWWGWRWWLLIT